MIMCKNDIEAISVVERAVNFEDELAQDKSRGEADVLKAVLGLHQYDMSYSLNILKVGVCRV